MKRLWNLWMMVTCLYEMAQTSHATNQGPGASIAIKTPGPVSGAGPRAIAAGLFQGGGRRVRCSRSRCSYQTELTQANQHSCDHNGCSSGLDRGERLAGLY